MNSVTEAEAEILSDATLLEPETIPPREAHGRILRETITADRDLPPFDRVTRDGITIAAQEGVTSFRIEATQYAGQSPLTLQDPATGCIQIMTGAALAHGCNAVIQYEDLTIEGDQATLRPGLTVSAGQNIHSRGSDGREGDKLLTPGCLLNGPRLGLIASTGRDRVLVSPFPSVAVVSNGDELIDVGLPVEPWQIRPSNNYAVAGTLQHRGFPKVSSIHLPDDPGELRDSLEATLASHRVVILSGGVSAGKRDYIPATLDALGVEKRLHKISQRPGKPMWFGSGPDGQSVFALPGNPISTIVCLHRYVLPFLETIMGAPAPAPTHVVLTEDIRFDHALTYFRPVKISFSQDGVCQATPIDYHGSGDLFVLAESDGFVELDRDTNQFPAGTAVPYHPWL